MSLCLSIMVGCEGFQWSVTLLSLTLSSTTYKLCDLRQNCYDTQTLCSLSSLWTTRTQPNCYLSNKTPWAHAFKAVLRKNEISHPKSVFSGLAICPESTPAQAKSQTWLTRADFWPWPWQKVLSHVILYLQGHRRGKAPGGQDICHSQTDLRDAQGL